METTQLTFLFGSRSQPGAKPTLQPGDDTLSAEQAFSTMLQKSLAEQAEQRQIDQQRQLDQERQNWRNQQPASYAGSQSTADTEPSSATSDTGSSRRADQTSSRDDPKDGSTAPSSSQQTSAANDRGDSKAAGKSDKSTGSKDKDGDQPDGAESASAAGNPTIGKQDAHHHGQAADGNAQSDGGHKKNQNQQDGQSQQATIDGDAVAVASEGAENTILAALLAGQPAPTKTGTGSLVVVGGQKSAGAANSAAGAAVGQTAGTAQAAGNAAATTAAGAAAAASLPVPGGAATPAATSAGQAGNAAGAAANAAQPQAAASLASATHAASTSELDNTFANIIAKKAPPASSNSDNLRVSVNKAGQDNAAQLPRPLVRIAANQAAQSNAQPVPTLTEDETVSVANHGADIDDNFDPQPSGLDGLSGLGSFSSSLPGADLGGIGKQIDSMTALRQQLATASLQNQVATQMQRAAGNNIDKISIDLSPAELGRIHVKMSVTDDKQVSATITVERPATLELLQRDTKGLERALQDAGLKTDSGNLSFTLQQGNQGNSSDTPGWGTNGGRQAGSSGQEKTAGMADISSASGKNEVDTANGLVDVAV